MQLGLECLGYLNDYYNSVQLLLLLLFLLSLSMAYKKYTMRRRSLPFSNSPILLLGKAKASHSSFIESERFSNAMRSNVAYSAYSAHFARLKPQQKQDYLFLKFSEICEL